MVITMTIAGFCPPVLPIRSTTKRSRCRQTRRQPCLSISRLPGVVPPRDKVGADLDAWFMRRALALAELATGQTRPNPIVGCVIVTPDLRIIGEGYHERAGKAHAEACALLYARRNTESTRRATVYVTLEPCSHYGRTPPCADALIRARVGRVVVGIVDPFPAVAGRGLRRLRDAGIQVDVGIERERCEQANEGFVHRIVNGAAFGTLKYAMSIDGKIATDTGSSRWVTGPLARERVHQMRASTDAIIVGGATLRKDDPRLTVRTNESEWNLKDRLAPMRVVMTKTLDLPLDARLWSHPEDELSGQSLVLVDSKHGRPSIVSELRARGVEVEEVPGLRPRDAATMLAEKECMNALWECGGALARDAVADGCIQKVSAFMAPKLVGGSKAPTPLDGTSLCDVMSDAFTLQKSNVEVFDDGDMLVCGYLENRDS